ncbi:MAG: hypothetical protein GY842_03090 [bacterium]|nr:hypothetical protein [bacterium]
MTRRIPTALGLAVLLSLSGACDVDNLLNRTASFGGDTAGQRTTFPYFIINNTPYRAILTAGAYDDLDENTGPQIRQFGADAARPLLEGDSTTGTFTANCARVFAIGTPGLLSIVESNVSADQLDSAALVPGVFFSGADLDSDDAASATEGVAGPLELRLGVDFACSSMLVISLEFDDVGPNDFRIDYEVIPAAAD